MIKLTGKKGDELLITVTDKKNDYQDDLLITAQEAEELLKLLDKKLK